MTILGAAPVRAARRLAFAVCLALPVAAHGGPPYTTDDPEPVECRHWELYLAFQNFWTRGAGADGTLPQVEVNYGVIPDLQLHAIVPVAWNAPSGATFRYGLGDVELGAKFRFVHEGEWVPQIGIYPLLELPSGNSARGLGAGRVQVLLPLWLQKSFGKWTTYGGAGYWIGNPGPGASGSWFVGWQAQCQFASWGTAGAEVYHGMTGQDGNPSNTRFNVGLVIDVSDLQHVLLSAGHSFTNPSGQAYAAYQLTFGPRD
ncbi:MAG TPA: hypothetical protein VMT17_18510 [Anaeromyxobacteraceae bacterium]|nr:hypothetical protein [Anaeromyxobacteraceae bacterium]